MAIRIGINALYLVPGEVGGSEIYVRELVRALGVARPELEFVVYCSREAENSLAAENWTGNVQLSPLGVSARNKPARVAYELLGLPRRARRDGIDLLHSVGQTTPLWGCGARVVTVLDLIFHHHPETFPGPARRGLELLVPLGARRAHRVAAISRATSEDLVTTYRIDPAKVDVTLLGAGFTPPTEALERQQLIAAGIELPEGDFALCVASGHAHKNVERLLEALTLLPERNLVLVGHAGLDQEKLRRRAAELGIAERTLFTGWIETAALEGIYRQARVFVYPTLLEGFGLPVLEAMRRGLPVVCSNTSSLPEVAGDAALLVDPFDVTALAEAVERVCVDEALRDDLVSRGRVQAERFSWERCAAATLATYTRALAAPTPL